MFSLLNPLALWIGAATLIPVLIHFIGRSQTRKLDFPSIALLKQKLVKSSRQQKLKNLLLLICRTLFILWLLLALSNPLYQVSEGAGKENAASLFIIHNGIWGSIRDNHGNSLLETQKFYLHSLDSLTGNHTRSLQVISGSSRNAAHQPQQVHQRYGDYRDVLKKVQVILKDFPGTYNKIFIPVFNWSELHQSENTLLSIEQQYPEIRLVIMDYSEYSTGISELTDIVLEPPDKEPYLNLTIRVSNTGGITPGARLKSFVHNRPVQEVSTDKLSRSSQQFFFQVPRQRSLEGSVILGGHMGWPAVHYFSYQKPGLSSILHSGSEFTTLASLGKEKYSKSIDHIDELKGDSLLSNLQNYRVLLLANSAIPADKAYGRLLEFVRQGGNLVITLGNRSDIPKLNRELLVPAKMGYLSTQTGEAADLKKNQHTPITLHTESFTQVEQFLTKFKPRGFVKQQFILSSSSVSNIVLSTKTGPLLVRTKFGKGEIFLWTTDLDNLEATSLGISSFTPVLHQWILNKNTGTQWKNITTWSDSLFTISEETTGGVPLTVQDPDKRNFPYQKKFGNYSLGPFSSLGHYVVRFGEDSLVVAVNLKPVPVDSLKEEYPTELHTKIPGTVILTPEKAITSRGGSYYKLWKLFLALAVLFLFLELAITKFIGNKAV